MIDDILAEGAMTEAHLRMLVEKIYVQETDGKLSLDIQIKAPFRTHLDVYKNGTLAEQYGALDFDWDRLARLLYGRNRGVKGYGNAGLALCAALQRR